MFTKIILSSPNHSDIWNSEHAEAERNFYRYVRQHKEALQTICKPDRPWPDTPVHRAEVRIMELRRQMPRRPVKVRVVKAPDAHGLAELRWLHQWLDKLILLRQGWRKVDRLVVSSGKSHPIFR